MWRHGDGQGHSDNNFQRQPLGACTVYQYAVYPLLLLQHRPVTLHLRPRLMQAGTRLCEMCRANVHNAVTDSTILEALSWCQQHLPS